jgi:hypothetical protein
MPGRCSDYEYMLSILQHYNIHTSVPFWGVKVYKRNDVVDPLEGAEGVVTNDYYNAALVLDFALGITVASIYFVLFVIAIGRQKKLFGNNEIISLLWLTSDELGSTRAKHAATRKIYVILTNARSMHGVVKGKENKDEAEEGKRNGLLSKKLRDSQTDPSFQNFLIFGEKLVPAGSITWTWQRLLTGEIFDHEGIWFPARLWVFQFGQVVVGFFVCAAMFSLIPEAQAAADKASQELPEGLPQWVYDMVPSGSEVAIALYPAAITACVVVVFLTAVYVPRYVALKQFLSTGYFYFALYTLLF